MSAMVSTPGPNTPGSTGETDDGGRMVWRTSHPLIGPDLLTRADVRVSRRYGWVVAKRSDTIAGCVWADVNAAGAPIWKAQSGDIGSFSFTREGAVQTVLDLWNMQEKARAFDLTTYYGGTR